MIEQSTLIGLIDPHDYGRDIKVTENRYETKITIFDIPCATGKITDKTPKSLTAEERKAKDEANKRATKTRAMESILQYAGNNQWDYFATITFDPNKVDRKDFNQCSKVIDDYLISLKKFIAYHKLPKMQYVVVPEKHKDGAFHFHALINNLPKQRITRATNKGKELCDKANRPIFNFDYEYGFTTVVPVGQNYEEQSKVGSYIAKYITKDLMASIKGAKCYWATRGLKKDNLIAQGMLTPGDKYELQEQLHEQADFKKSVAIKATNNNKHIYILRKEQKK